MFAIYFVMFDIYLNYADPVHCVKSIQIRSFFWSIFSCIRTRKNSVFAHFSGSGMYVEDQNHNTKKKLLEFYIINLEILILVDCLRKAIF